MLPPPTVNGTVTVWPDAADSCAVTVTVVTLSRFDWLADVHDTVGAASLSWIVTVCVVGAAAVAFVGVPMLTMIVSSPSSMRSFTTVIVNEPVVEPAGIEIGLAEIV